MPLSANNTTLTYNDSTLQTTRGCATFELAEVGTNGTFSPVTLTAGTWTVRRITNQGNTIAGASVNASTWTVTLPSGSYLVNANARTSNTSDGQFSRNIIRLRDVTNNGTLIMGIGATTIDSEFGFASSNTNLVGMITLNSTTNLQLQHWASITVAGGFPIFAGIPSSGSFEECYANIIFSKIG